MIRVPLRLLDDSCNNLYAESLQDRYKVDILRVQEQSHVPTLRIQLLGTPQIFLDGQPVRDFVTRKAQALFFYLAVTRQAHLRDALAALFWRDLSNQQARNNLRRNLPNLRALVGSYLHIERDLVAFDLTLPLALDTVDFSEGLNACMADASLRSIESLKRAVALYRGDFLEGFSVGDAPEFEAWALVQRENLRRMAIWGFDQLATAYLESGQLEEGLEVTNRLLTLEPWYEAAYHKQMIMLARTGQRQAALGQYEKCRAMLAEEFGAQPAPEMTALYEQLKGGELAAEEAESRSSESRSPDQASSPHSNRHLGQVAQFARVNWGMIPRAATFYGRQYELAQLRAWVLREKCTLITILGIGGVGKTALATQFVRGLASLTQEEQATPGFDRILWRSLLNAPQLEDVVGRWLQEISDHELTLLPPTLDERLSLLFTYLRRQSCLLVLDNLESILQAGDAAGHFQPGYEDYALFFQQIGDTEHKSCLLLTSRELPLLVARLERTYPVVRSLRIEGLSTQFGLELLRAMGLDAPRGAMESLVQRYSGNPLALRLVAEVVLDHYDGNVIEFLAQETLIFEDIRTVLDQQFDRLTSLERDIFFWLAIEREPISLQKLARNFVQRPESRALLEALRSLYRRSLVEWDHPLARMGDEGEVRFALQNVVLEYATEQLHASFVTELSSGKLDVCGCYALVLAQAADYVRDAQTRLILQPVAVRLHAAFGMGGMARKLQSYLEQLRSHDAQAGYAAANLLHLALHLGIQLHGWDFSHLPIWQADLRKARLPKTNFAMAHFLNTAFMEKFDAILAIDLSADGELLAAGGASSNIQLWRVKDTQLLRVYPGTKRWVWAVAFSPNGQILASGSSDCVVRLWEVPAQPGEAEHGNTPESYALTGHTDTVFALAFHPNGRWLASGSADQTVRLWDVARNVPLQTLKGHSATVYAVAFAPQGTILASASRDHNVRLWRVDSGESLQVLAGHQSPVIALHFSTDGRWLVTASVDGMVQVWQVRLNDALKPPLCELVRAYYSDTGEIATLALSPSGETIAMNGPHATVRLRKRIDGELINTFHGHTEKSQSLAFHPNGKLLVSGGWDQSVRFWDLTTGDLLRTLQGHINAVNKLAMSPDGQIVVSGNRDGTLCLWATSGPRLIHSHEGHAGSVQTVAFHPNGQLLASGGSDGVLRLWRVDNGRLTAYRTLQGRHDGVQSLAFSRAGHRLASSSEDRTVCIWDVDTGDCANTLHGHTRKVGALVFGSNDEYLLSGSEDGHIYRWAIATDGELQPSPLPFALVPGGCNALALSPDGSLVAGSGADHVIRLWRTTDGQLLASAETPVNSTVYSLTFSPQHDRQTLQLVSSSGTGAIGYWDIDAATKEFTLRYLVNEHRGSVRSVELTPDGQTLISGGADETIRFWNAETGECLHTLHLELPYEGMNITGASGLTAAQRVGLIALGAVEQDALSD